MENRVSVMLLILGGTSLASISEFLPVTYRQPYGPCPREFSGSWSEKSKSWVKLSATGNRTRQPARSGACIEIRWTFYERTWYMSRSSVASNAMHRNANPQLQIACWEGREWRKTKWYGSRSVSTADGTNMATRQRWANMPTCQCAYTASRPPQPSQPLINHRPCHRKTSKSSSPTDFLHQ